MGQKRDITKGEQKTALLFIYIVLYLCTICSFNLQGERHAGRSLQSFYKRCCLSEVCHTLRDILSRMLGFLLKPHISCIRKRRKI